MKKLVVLCFLFLFACTGGFQTSKLDQNTWQVKQTINGIIYYEPHMVKVTYEYTTLVDANGKLIGTASEGKCRQSVQKEELSIQPDFSNPRILTYKAPMLSSGQFGVTLNNGMITSINIQTTSVVQTGLEAIASVASSGVVPKVYRSELPACNAEPVITSIVNFSNKGR